MRRIFSIIANRAQATESFPYGKQAMGPSISDIRAKAQAYAKAQGDQPRAIYLIG